VLGVFIERNQDTASGATLVTADEIIKTVRTFSGGIMPNLTYRDPVER
jgi:hypothetical protein